jgi:hypothetical protein
MLVGGILLVAIFILSLAYLDEMTVFVRRRIRGPEPVWNPDGRVLDVSYDSQGLVASVLYAGSEGPLTRLTWWLRLWQPDKGIVWQWERASNHGVLLPDQGTVIFATPDERGLCAVDARTGQLRWKMALKRVVTKGVWLKGADLLYLLENKRWLQVRATDGFVIAEGKLANEDDEAALFADTVEPGPPLRRRWLRTDAQ